MCSGCSGTTGKQIAQQTTTQPSEAAAITSTEEAGNSQETLPSEAASEESIMDTPALDGPEDPEELDTRFSKFAPSPGGDWESAKESALEKLEGAEELLNLIGKVKESVSALSEKPSKETAEEEKKPSLRFFSFETMDQVIQAAHLLKSIYFGSNTLYKDQKADLYILVLTQSDLKTRDFNRICNMLSEYGSLEKASSASLAFRRLTRTRACYRVNWRRIRFEGPMLRQVVTLGIPSGVQSSVVSLANVIVQANINAFGSAAMAGCGAYSKIEGFAFLPVTCFALALSTFVSQNIGARRFDRVRQGMKFGLICSPVLAELIGVAIFTLAPFLIALFNSDPTVVSFGVDDARTVSLFYCLLSFSHCCAGILRGMGRPVVPMAIMLCVWCALRITYITVTVHFIPDIHVVYWAYPLTWAISSVLFLFCLRRMRFPSEEHGEPASYTRG